MYLISISLYIQNGGDDTSIKNVLVSQPTLIKFAQKLCCEEAHFYEHLYFLVCVSTKKKSLITKIQGQNRLSFYPYPGLHTKVARCSLALILVHRLAPF